MGRLVLARAIVLGAAASGALVAGCHACGPAGEPSSSLPASASTTVAIPAPPASLAAHGVVAPPATGWPALRAALADEAKGWPRSFGAAVVGQVGLPITAAEHVSTDAPIPLVVLAAEGGGADVVAAFHLRAADRVEVLATAGEGARLRAERDADMIRLVPARAGDVMPAHLALVGNHLVAATSASALVAAGSFVARAAPPALPDGALAVAHLGPELPRLARAHLERLRAIAHVPGMPSSSTSAPLGTLLDALIGGQAELRVGAEAIELVVTGPASLAAAGASLAASQGPAAPWLALPAASTLAVLLHASAADRAAEATQAGERLGDALGLVATRRLRFGAALQELARARSSPVAFATGPTPEGSAAWIRAGLDDVDAADRALDELAFAAGKKVPDRAGTSLTGKRTVVERVGDAVRLKVRAGDPEEGGATAVDVLVRREDDALLGAVGTDAAAALRVLRAAAKGEGALADHALARRVAASAETHVALAFVDFGAPSAPGARAADGMTAAASVSLAGSPRITALLEPRALAVVRAKLRPSAP